MEDQITSTIADFCRISGIGRSSVYEMIAAGELHSVTMGRRRLIVIESYRTLLARKWAQEQQTNGGGAAPTQESGSRPRKASGRAGRAS